MKTKGFAKHYYMMMAPGLLWLVLFSIVPMFGIVIAFQDFNPGKGDSWIRIYWTRNL